MAPRLWLWITLLAGAASATLAEEPEVPEPADLLPGPTDLVGWIPEGEPGVYPRGRLDEYRNGGADVLEEYGYEVGAIREWARGEETVAFHVYRMADATGACGLFTQVRSRGAEALDVGSGGFATAGGLAFWKGRWFVQMDLLRGGKDVRRTLHALARKTATRIPGDGAEPPLLALLRAPSLVAGTDRLLRGPLALGGAETFGAALHVDGFELAAAAEYRRDGRTTRVLVADYDAEEAAAAALAAVAEVLRTEGSVALVRARADDERILAWREGRRVRILVR